MNLQRRRDALTKALGGGLVVLTAYDAMQLSGDMAAPFLQESNFWWLCAIEEPGWRLIIEPGAHGSKATLVRPARSQIQQIFDGATDEQSIKDNSGASMIIDVKDCEQYLRQLATKHTVVYTPYARAIEHDFVSNPAQKDLSTQLKRLFTTTIDCTKQLAELRAVKSPEEIAAIRKAVKLTCHTFAAVRTQLETYRYEYEVEADMTREFRRVNAAHAYEPIVAGGSHAVTLHYTKNHSRLAKQQLLLIDVGARVDGYAADITRTYCANPTKRQQQVHQAVQQASEKIIRLLRPDLPVAEYVEKVDDIMKDALGSLGLLPDRNDNDQYRRYFPHAVSHGLGIDVHDSLGSPRYFRPGMVLTVEPGIYIPEEGIGVRIEDDILITANGCENLSRGLPTAL